MFIPILGILLVFEQMMGTTPLASLPPDEVTDSLASPFIQGTLANQGA